LNLKEHAMARLVESKTNPGTFASDRRQACPHCGGETFRDESDTAGLEPFDILRAQDGTLWKYLNAMKAGLSEHVVCVQCEKARRASNQLSKKPVLVGFDNSTGEEIEVAFPLGEVRWGV
jgi:hypothetical protein